jgi:hypothetical protein
VNFTGILFTVGSELKILRVLEDDLLEALPAVSLTCYIVIVKSAD